MLDAQYQALLDNAVTLARGLTPKSWELNKVLHDGGEVVISFSDDFQTIKVTLFGAAQANFDDWYAACDAYCWERDPPRQSRHVPALGDRIIFALRSTSRR